jgi:four helix bundle protein
MSYIYNFEKLEVWKQARLFVVDIYTLTKKYPIEEKFGLSSQMQRASVSIILNITEGTSRFSDKEKIRFIEIAYTSLMEVLAQLYVSLDLKYICQSQLDALKEKIDLIAIQLNGLVKSYKNRAIKE